MNASNPKKQYGSEIDWKEAIGSNYYIISINKANNSAPLIDTLPWGNSITTYVEEGGGGVSRKSPGGHVTKGILYVKSVCVKCPFSST